MTTPFRPPPPAHALAEAFRARIRTGLWGDTAPGIAKIQADLHVGRPLVEKALALLIQSGELIDQGRRRALKVNRAACPPPARQGTLIAHDMDPDLNSSEIMRAVHRLKDGLPAPVTLLKVAETQSDAELIRRLAESDAAWIIPVNLPARVGDTLHAAGRRVIHLGSRAPQVVAPRVCASLEHMIRQGIRRAFEAGHRRVSFPLWRFSPDSLDAALGWVADEYRLAGIRHSPSFDTPVVRDPSPQALHDCIRNLFRLTPPTAVLAFAPPHWIAITSTLAELRLRIPDDVSMIQLAAFTESANATPSPAHLAVNLDAYLPAVLRIMRDIELGLTPESVIVDHLWHPGGSLGAPKHAASTRTGADNPAGPAWRGPV